MGEKAERFIILRNCPPGFEEENGRCYVLAPGVETLNLVTIDHVRLPFGPTGRFETREDGSQAEVFEPCEPSRE